MSNETHKPLISTIINTTALALTAGGTNIIINCCDVMSRPQWHGYVMILFGAGLEFIKYLGRKKKLW